MNSLHDHFTSIVALAMLSCTATALTAQERSGNFDRSVGNSYLGGSFHAFGTIRRSVSGPYTDMRSMIGAHGTAQVNRASYRVGSLAAGVLRATAGATMSRYGYVSLELVGRRLIDQRFTYRWSESDRFLLNAFDREPTTTIGLGPFNVTLRGNASAGGSYNLSMLNPANEDPITQSGTASVWSEARCSVSIDFWLAGVELSFSGKVGNTSLNVMGIAGPRILMASATLRMIPIDLLLKIRAWLFGFSWEETLARFTSSPITLRLF